MTDNGLMKVLHEHFMNELLAQLVIVDAHRLLEYSVANAYRVPSYPTTSDNKITIFLEGPWREPTAR